MFFNFVNVLLVVEYDGGVAFVSRKESEFGSLFHQGFQSSALFREVKKRPPSQQNNFPIS